MLALFATIATLTAAVVGAGQTAPPKPGLDKQERTEAINGVLRRLKSDYVFPDVAAKMEAAVREREAHQEYDAIRDGDALAAKLTRDLRDVCHDLHLSVNYSETILPPDSEAIRKPSSVEMEAMRRQVKRENFGLEKAQILKGNIGYLKVNYFVSPEWSGEATTAAMNYLAGTDAMILDLRENSGSMSEQAIPFLCGYFFAKPTHLNSIYWRPDNKTFAYYSKASVPGKRYLEKPIYVLTSGGTFSGAEELAYDLQNLKRAALIGDTTGGGANPGGSRRVTDHFSIWVPVGRAINPITHTNWEGKGVVPDVAVPAAKALYTAHLAALSALESKTTDAAWKRNLQNLRADLQAHPPVSKPVMFTLKGYPDAKDVYVAGSFNGWSRVANRLTRQGDVWAGSLEAEPGRHTYKFVVDGIWITDPANPQIEQGSHFANSIMTVP